MGTILRKVILPCVLVVAGTAMIGYGARCRTLSVWEEARVAQVVMEEKEIEVPAGGPGLPPGGFLPGEGPGGSIPGVGAPGGLPGMMGPSSAVLVKQTVLVPVTRHRQTEREVDEPEPAVIQEITVGGIALAGPGKLFRTYRRAEAGWEEADLPPPPSRCPT